MTSYLTAEWGPLGPPCGLHGFRFVMGVPCHCSLPVIDPPPPRLSDADLAAMTTDEFLRLPRGDQ